ncbi:MAG TPA: hypothetical protein VG796_04125 [Verrucomicrobiales bacterium]|nr:hypothetical protein [Verrucomicrobiales bacterium]
MKLTLLFFFATSLCVPAQYTPSQVQVRVVTFADAGVETALQAIRPGCDNDLFTALSQSAAGGEAKIVSDQVLLVRGGQRSRAIAAYEFPYATGHNIDSSLGLMIPTLLVWQSAGPQLEAEATVGVSRSLGFPGRPIDLNVGAENQTMLSQMAWPVADLRGQGEMGSVSMPLASIHKSNLQALTGTGMTMLLSVAGEPQRAADKDMKTRFLYTFLRAGVKGETPKRDVISPPAVSFQRRLHAVSLRVPTETAVTLMSRRSDDHALFTALFAKAARGEADVSGNTAILGRNGQRSRIESTLQFPYPLNYEDFFPDKWSYRPLGTLMEADAGGEFAEIEKPLPGDWTVALEVSGAPELTNFYPDKSRPNIYIPQIEYTSRQFTGHVTVPASGILCAGAISSVPATQKGEAAEGMTDILFFVQSPPPTAPEKQQKPQRWLEAMLLSVSEQSGRTLAAGGDASGLLERLGAADVRCAGFAAVAAEGEHRNEIKWQRHVPHPAGFGKSATLPDLEIPSSWEGAACGLKLEAAFASRSGTASLNATLAWDSSPVASLGLVYIGPCKREDRLRTTVFELGMPACSYD